MDRLGFWLVALTTIVGCGRLGFDAPQTPSEECTLALDAGASRLNFHSQRAVQIVGGTDPVELSVSAIASIDATGLVTSRGIAGPATVAAVDAGGCTAEATVEIGGDTLFYVGGTFNTMPSADVLSSVDGLAWTTKPNALPARRTSGALLVYRDKLWWISGSDGVGARGDVYASSDGVTWTLVGQVTRAGLNPGFAVFHDRMWLIGGDSSPDTDEVYSSTDGATWKLEGHLPELNHGGSAVVMNDQLWYLGGHNNNSGKLYDWVLRTNDGATWTPAGSMLQGREYASAYVEDDAIVYLGGQNTSAVRTTDVIATTNGSAFASTGDLPLARAFGAVAWFQGAAWSVGGSDGGAVIRGSRTTPWTTPTTTGFATPRQGGRLAVFSAL